MLKAFVLDINVLMDVPNIYDLLEPSIIYIPSIIIKELDGLKNSKDCETHDKSKVASNELAKFTGLGYLRNGITIPSGSCLKTTDKYEEVDCFKNNDDILMGTVLALQKEFKDRVNVILLSNNANMRLSANNLSIKACEYKYPHNYFEELELTNNATLEEITERFKILSKQYDDDLQNVTDEREKIIAAKRKIRLDKIYRVLSDPDGLSLYRIKYQRSGINLDTVIRYIELFKQQKREAEERRIMAEREAEAEISRVENEKMRQVALEAERIKEEEEERLKQTAKAEEERLKQTAKAEEERLKQAAKAEEERLQLETLAAKTREEDERERLRQAKLDVAKREEEEAEQRRQNLLAVQRKQKLRRASARKFWMAACVIILLVGALGYDGYKKADQRDIDNSDHAKSSATHKKHHNKIERAKEEHFTTTATASTEEPVKAKPIKPVKNEISAAARDCFGTSPGSDKEEIVKACTHIIMSKKYSKNDKGKAYLARGIAQEKKYGSSQEAFEDFGNAYFYDPDLVEARYRKVSEFIKGDSYMRGCMELNAAANHGFNDWARFDSDPVMDKFRNEDCFKRIKKDFLSG